MPLLRRDASALLADRLTAAEALDLLRALYGHVVVVLESAERSAREWTGGENLFGELVKLVTQYRDVLRSGGGDDEARRIFGKNRFPLRSPKQPRTIAVRCGRGRFGTTEKMFTCRVI